ncbi:type II toxin-antitoxin system VapC family toxin [Blastococcus capsensis]|uniref:type II toxin-antitoxin system VapC family toxin n=1 Tax=Blastococcus capsensis TaxID=1564163 RepID=UPI00253F936D|nr:type II toxin-antitoxin system VapC family toxin [Blastococcus capsensis]MDK3254912.1 type II toxin-antitoxin system VapC family toxin [Blastococcus capsensis]
MPPSSRRGSCGNAVTVADGRRSLIRGAGTACGSNSLRNVDLVRLIGKLAIPDDLAEELERQGFAAIPITVEDGLAAGALPRHHADPFDRILIAQAMRRGLVLVTADRRFADYDVLVLT